jgi:hypothetical protein
MTLNVIIAYTLFTVHWISRTIFHPNVIITGGVVLVVGFLAWVKFQDAKHRWWFENTLTSRLYERMDEERRRMGFKPCVFCGRTDSRRCVESK